MPEVTPVRDRIGEVMSSVGRKASSLRRGDVDRGGEGGDGRDEVQLAFRRVQPMVPVCRARRWPASAAGHRHVAERPGRPVNHMNVVNFSGSAAIEGDVRHRAVAAGSWTPARCRSPGRSRQGHWTGRKWVGHGQESAQAGRGTAWRGARSSAAWRDASGRGCRRGPGHRGPGDGLRRERRLARCAAARQRIRGAGEWHRRRCARPRHRRRARPAGRAMQALPPRHRAPVPRRRRGAAAHSRPRPVSATPRN